MSYKYIKQFLRLISISITVTHATKNQRYAKTRLVRFFAFVGLVSKFPKVFQDVMTSTSATKV